MTRKIFLLTLAVIAATTYYVKTGTMPSIDPAGDNTLIVGRVEYFLPGKYSAQASNEFVLSVRSSKTGSFTVTTDEDGFFSFPIWAGSKVRITDIESRGVNVLSLPKSRLRTLVFVGSETGVTNIGTIYWMNYGSDLPHLQYGFNTGKKYYNCLAEAQPDSPWLQEDWHRVELESSNNNH